MPSASCGPTLSRDSPALARLFELSGVPSAAARAGAYRLDGARAGGGPAPLGSCCSAIERASSNASASVGHQRVTRCTAVSDLRWSTTWWPEGHSVYRTYHPRAQASLRRSRVVGVCHGAEAKSASCEAPCIGAGLSQWNECARDRLFRREHRRGRGAHRRTNRPDDVRAVVSRGGRPDLAEEALERGSRGSSSRRPRRSGCCPIKVARARSDRSRGPLSARTAPR